MNRRVIWLLVPLGLALGVVYAFNPETHTFYPRCLLTQLTGYRCATCGGLRAMHHLLHGEFAVAWRYNAFVISVLCVAAGELLVSQLWGGGNRRLYIAGGIAIGAIVFTFLRNM